MMRLIIMQTWQALRKSVEGMTESKVRNTLKAFEPLWNGLFPVEQSRIIVLLVERVDVRIDRIVSGLRLASAKRTAHAGNSVLGLRSTF
jgi:site-specific DNA recombinase